MQIAALMSGPRSLWLHVDQGNGTWALLFHLSALLFHSVMRLQTKVLLSFMSRQTLEYIYFQFFYNVLYYHYCLYH